ncbi:MAG: hypothetical protein QMB47_05540, partial [Bacteroidales bacterium]
ADGTAIPSGRVGSRHLLQESDDLIIIRLFFFLCYKIIFPGEITSPFISRVRFVLWANKQLP